MALGQRKRRSWLLSSALYASPILLGLVGSYAGLTRTLVSPYQSVKRLIPGGTAPIVSATPYLNRNLPLPTRSGHGKSGGVSLQTAGASAASGGAKPQTLGRSDVPFISNGGEDDIHPAYDQTGQAVVYSSTVGQANKILPPPRGCDDDGRHDRRNDHHDHRRADAGSARPARRSHTGGRPAILCLS